MRISDWSSDVCSSDLLAIAAEQRFDSLSGGQQARFQILMLELSGATLLLLDEPTDNLDVASAEALEAGLEAFDEFGTASGRERVCKSCWISVVAGLFKHTNRVSNRPCHPIQ